MTEDRRAPVQKHEGRLSRRLLDLVRGVAASDSAHRSTGAGPALRVVPPLGGTHTHADIATQREELFSTVRVAPEFSPRAYARTFAALQLSPSAKVLDLTPARLLSADVFERLASAWTAPPDAVPRLGIVLSFERWVMLRETALAALQPLAARGVKVEVFYDEQAWGVRLDTWFSHGEVVHNVSAVVATLNLRWQPCSIWPMVIDTLSRLVRAHHEHQLQEPRQERRGHHGKRDHRRASGWGLRACDVRAIARYHRARGVHGQLQLAGDRQLHRARRDVHRGWHGVRAVRGQRGWAHRADPVLGG